MAYEFKLNRRVEFADTDLAGIMHFSNFFRLMEATEHAFYRSLGFSVDLKGMERNLGLPRVHAECEYKHPLRFEDVVEIHLLVKEKRERSIQFSFIFNKLNDGPVKETARGSLSVVCVDLQGPGGEMVLVAIPQEIADKIEVVPDPSAKGK